MPRPAIVLQFLPGCGRDPSWRGDHRTVARDALTVQEAQVARLAATGHTNPGIGAQLAMPGPHKDVTVCGVGYQPMALAA